MRTFPQCTLSSTRSLLLLAFLLLLALPATAAEDEANTALEALAGQWHGTLDAGQAQLRLIFHVEVDDAGTASATLDSPDQGATGIPVASVERTDSTVTFALTAIGASFSGTLDADGRRIEGAWSQGGQSLPLTMDHRAAEEESSEDATGD